MDFNEIRNKAYTFMGENIWIFDYDKINKNIIEILNLCIKNNINLKLSDDDLVKIINIYYINYNKIDILWVKKIISLIDRNVDYIKLIDGIGINRDGGIV